MQSKVTLNYTATVDDGKKIRNKTENEKQTGSGSFDLHHSAAQTYQTIGEFKKAISSYSKALDMKPGDKKCLIARGRCHLKVGNAEEAFKDANEISESDPEYVKSLLIKADSLHQMAQFEYALMHYHRGRRLRPEMKEFGQGIQRAEEAIYNAIGDNSGIVFKIPDNLTDFCDELAIQKTLGLSILTSTKMRLLEKAETVNNISGGNKTSREERKCGDEIDHEDLLKQEGERLESALETKAKTTCGKKPSKQLLGELHADKEFLESLLYETETASNQSDANKQIRSLTIKELNFLGSRSEFWEQQKPLYSRNHEKFMKELSYNKNKNNAKSSDWIAQEIEHVENEQHHGNYKVSLDKSLKLLKMLEKRPNDDVSKMGKIYSLMGKACTELGDFKEALKWHQHEFDFAVKNKSQGSESKALESMGRILMQIGDFKAALDRFQKRAKKDIDRIEKSWLMHEIGRCYFGLKKYKQSEEFGIKSLEEAKLEYNEVGRLKAILLVASSQENRKEILKALDNYKEALMLSSSIEEKQTEEIIKKAINDLEMKAQNDNESIETPENDDGNYSHDDDDDDDDGDSKDSSIEITSITSMSNHSSSQMSSVCGQSSIHGSKVRKCPQNKDTKVSKYRTKISNANRSPSIDMKHKKNKNCPRKGKDDKGDDDNDDDDGVEKKEQKTNKDDLTKESISYNVAIKTGNVFSAGTRADVFMQIYGKHGKTEVISLKNSLTNHVPFEDGKTDKFLVDAAEVGTIKQVKIFHNGSQMNDGWFLEEISIASPVFEEIYSFYTHRWLCKFNDDGKTARTLEPTNVSTRPQVDYKVTLMSGGDSSLTNSINVFVSIFGKHLKTDKIPFRISPNHSEASFVDRVKVRGTDVRKITKVKVGSDNLRLHSRWHLQELTIKHGSKTYSFVVDEWFEKDGRIEKELIPSRVSDEKPKSGKTISPLKKTKEHLSGDDDDDDGKKSHGTNKRLEKSKKKERNKENIGEAKKKNKRTLFTIEVKSGNHDCEGADGNIFIILIGQKATSSKLTLRGSSKKKAFQRGGVDVFRLECIDVGEISRIKIGHNGSKRYFSWFAESVKVESRSRAYLFEVNKWFYQEKGDGKIVRCCKPCEVVLKRKTGDNDDMVDDQNVDDHDNDENEVFGSNRYQDDGDDDVFNNDEMKNKGENSDDNLDGEDHEEASYSIKVRTGKCFGAGTDANVFIRIEGDKGWTDKIALDKTCSLKKERLFGRGQANHFVLKAKDVGKIIGISIGHDGSKLGAGWFLDNLKIEVACDVYRFDIHQWLDRKEGDGQIERHLLPSTD